MARRSKEAQSPTEESLELTKEEDKIARFLRFNCPTKIGNLNGNEYHYFVGSKAVDTLLESKKYGKDAKEPMFKTQIDCERFVNTLIMKGAVFRAKKVVLKKKTAEDRRRERLKREKDAKGKKTGALDSPRVRRLKEEEERLKEESDSGTDAKQDGEETEKEDKEDKKERKKKVMLMMVQHQSFSVDTSDVYGWLFDPTPFFKKVIGLLMIIGVVVGCLFPLWPDWLRLGVYYLSMSGIFLLLALMGTALARTILFGIIYGLSMGKHQLWVLPNLTADCGFFESFQPFYTYEYVSGEPKKDKKKGKSKDSKESESGQKSTTESGQEKLVQTEKPPAKDEDDDEEEDENSERTPEDEDAELNSAPSSQEEEEEPVDLAEQDEPEPEPFVPEASSRRRRRARKDDDNDFVMVDK